MGSLRFRRSKRLAPGVRVNVSKRGVGLSVGNRVVRASRHSTGSATRSVGIPGTGLHYRDQRRGGSGRARGGGRAGTARGRGSTGAAPTDVGSVRELLEGLGPERGQPPAPRALRRAARDGDLVALTGLAGIDGPVRHAATAAALLLAVEVNRAGEVASLAAGFPTRDVLADEVAADLLHGVVPVPLVPGLAIPLPARAALLVAVAHVLTRTGDYGRAVAFAGGVDPTDEATAAITVECARGHNGLGRFASAREELAPVIRRTSLSREVRCAALEQRALANLGAGRRTPARRDHERLADLSPDFPSLPALARLVAG